MINTRTKHPVTVGSPRKVFLECTFFHTPQSQLIKSYSTIDSLFCSFVGGGKQIID
jgi:hypothetical protein